MTRNPLFNTPSKCPSEMPWQVSLIQATPGISAKNNLLVLSHIRNLKFVVLNGYSRGTGSTEDLALVKNLAEQNIHIFRTSRFEGGNADCGYEAGLNLEEAGATGLGHLSAEEAITFLQNQIQKGVPPETIAQNLIQHSKIATAHPNHVRKLK